MTAILSNWFYRDFKVVNPVKCSLCYLALKLNFQADLYLLEITKKKKYWELFLIAKLTSPGILPILPAKGKYKAQCPYQSTQFYNSRAKNLLNIIFFKVLI